MVSHVLRMSIQRAWQVSLSLSVLEISLNPSHLSMSFHAGRLGSLVMPHVLCSVIHHKHSVVSHKGQTGIFTTLKLFTSTASLLYKLNCHGCKICCVLKHKNLRPVYLLALLFFFFPYIHCYTCVNTLEGYLGNCNVECPVVTTL